MRAILLNAEIFRAIDAAVDAARAKPVPWEVFKRAAEGIDQDQTTLSLKDRPPDFKRPQSQHVLIPMGFRASISFEDQPAGLVRHLSISVEGGKAIGFSVPKAFESFERVWTEEYEPGKWAINLLQLDHERAAPTETPQ
jgi:hypothetical protein